MTKVEKLPKFFQSALWSYNLDSFDPNNPVDKKIIIESVLNHGTDEQLQWVLGYYTLKDIKNVLKDPSRGSWDPRVLSYWTKVLGMKINKEKYVKAINSLYLQARIH